ncbi:MAG: hypothetical protein KBT44_00690 [Bacteroidales bacterium]|nr:hypothetical protein [Candidatus Equibacterium intestinale]
MADNTLDKSELEYLDSFEKRLEQNLLTVCRGVGMNVESFLESADITAFWTRIAPEYMAEAVKSINSYPQFTLGCAAYCGMAAAKIWDRSVVDFNALKYSDLLGKRGFDDMDDHIVTSILGLALTDPRAKGLCANLYSCAEACMNEIMKENIEGSSLRAFHILSRTLKTMFRLGASLQLRIMGYKMEKIGL